MDLNELRALANVICEDKHLSASFTYFGFTKSCDFTVFKVPGTDQCDLELEQTFWIEEDTDQDAVIQEIKDLVVILELENEQV